MHSSRFRLSACERSALESLIHDPVTPRRVLQRIHIVWMVAMGSSVRAVAAEVGVSEHTVRLWIARFRDAGVSGLRDLPRPGAPRIHGSAVLTTIRETAACSPAERGVPQRRWTLDALLRYLGQQYGIVIGRSRLHELLREAGVDWRSAPAAASETQFVATGDASGRARAVRAERPLLRRVPVLPARPANRSRAATAHHREFQRTN